ncbi:hypothetical protein HY29_17510 [Hyphomonas beringensis]|uniref:Uncharacterized protein n=1 Tax=Hyphomonas beringensis TaxID=1280946 RepID=A0A062U4L2_9PROT|nr:hypothetical protein [Hyphomonas beringensis]KCZ53212.1 hypothetical protein HY29_17510 [Hyphomonas beringensis]
MGKETWPKFYQRLIQDNRTAFRGAQLKVMRADHLLEELEIAIRVLPQSIGKQFLIGLSGETVHITFLPDQMPLQLSAALGDCVHNIRSAFDHVAVALTAPPIGTGNPNYSGMPTGKDQNAYEGERAKKMKGAPPSALAIIDALEPWRGGRNLVRELHELDIMDKHRLLVPAIAEMHIRSMGAEIRGRPITITGNDVRSVADGQNFVIEIPCPGIKSHTEFKLTNSLKADFSIKFDRDHPCAGELVLPALKRMRATASELLEKCETAFPGVVSWRVMR